MIRLTRIRHREELFLNPDLFERIERHHDTIVRLHTGVEYVVCEHPDEIVEQIILLRARVLAAAADLTGSTRTEA